MQLGPVNRSRKNGLLLTGDKDCLSCGGLACPILSMCPSKRGEKEVMNEAVDEVDEKEGVEEILDHEDARLDAQAPAGHDEAVYALFSALFQVCLSHSRPLTR